MRKRQSFRRRPETIFSHRNVRLENVIRRSSGATLTADAAHMSHKRSRAAFEADNHAPFAVFGTPLPDEAASRDDGSFLPLWKQEVRDDKGRKRLHGAFTGGWSAG